MATGFTRASEMYAVPEPQTLVPVAQWVEKDWEKLPARRIDLAVCAVMALDRAVSYEAVAEPEFFVIF